MGKWIAQEELGRGGQGITYLAENSIVVHTLLDTIRKAVKSLSAPIGTNNEKTMAHARSLAESIRGWSSALEETGVAALKILHESVQQNEKAMSRLAQEIETLSKHPHPNILKIIDSSASQGWFAATYFPLKTLSNNMTRFKGRPLVALEALRPIVDAVASLHRQKLIHRDIKPDNIFFSDDGLMLGDFGLVFFADEARTRISDTYENVGSRDWMPPWAYGKRVEDLTLSFDVFSLGKVLWAMVSGKSLLPLWYHRRPEYDLTRLFPKDPHVHLINAFLDLCIKENQDDHGYPDAIALLEQIDRLLEIMRRDGELLRRDIGRICRVCGYGEYVVRVDDTKNNLASESIGFRAVPRVTWRIFSCNRCGNVQLFLIDKSLEAWGIEAQD
jgi:serine/threonine protein kinase